MKAKTIFCAALALVLGIGMTANAALTTTVVVTDGPFGTGTGGLFTVTRTSGSDIGASIDSFCIELNEFVQKDGTTTYWIELSDSALGGGYSGGSPDPLDPKTAALFQQWRSLAVPTDALANLYQLAIWVLEDEAIYDNVDGRWERNDGGDSPVGSIYTNIPLIDVTNLIASVGNPATTGSVQVMRLWRDVDGTRVAQDMLWVPVPGAVLLGVIGMGLLVGVMRRN